jgi:hypothetical protein
MRVTYVDNINFPFLLFSKLYNLLKMGFNNS